MAVVVIGYSGIFQLTYFPALLVLGPFVTRHDLGGARAWGTILALDAVGALIGGLLALRLRFAGPLVATALLVVPAGLIVLLLSFPAPLWAIAAVSFVSGRCFAVDGTVWFTTLQEKIPEHATSRVSSFA